MSSRDLLLEIGTEEIPARFMPNTLKDIKSFAETELAENHISYADVSVFATPRRIALMITGLSELQNDIVEKSKGPLKSQAYDESGNPSKSAIGFAKSKGINVEDLKIQMIGNLEYIFAEKHYQGKNTIEILPELLERIIKKLSFPKSMYWSDKTIKFARPVRWLIALYGEEVLEITFANIKSGRNSRGHRFMGAKLIEIKNMSSYQSQMRENFVIIDPEERKKMICDGIKNIEGELNAVVDIPEALLEENIHLNEYPIPFYGSFDSEFLEIPEEVLTLSMAVNQRYFPVRDKNGKLMPNFVGVSNNLAKDMSVVREGNERVLRARLYDASFFWKEDLTKSMDERVEELKNVTYQVQLGSVYDKVQRVKSLALYITEILDKNEFKKFVDRASYLAKSDLVSNMVYEFSDVQGVMGREYARKAGEPEEVALAIYEQYLPKNSGGDLPTGIVGAILGIAERTDTISGIFKIGLEPTSSQDPYGLRRAARSLNEIIWGLGLHININDLFRTACKTLSIDDEIFNKIMKFFMQRTQVQLKEKGFNHEIVMLSMQTAKAFPLQVLRMCETLEKSSDEEWFSNLVTSAVRVNNILVKNQISGTSIDEMNFVDPLEIALYNKLNELTDKVRETVDSFDWEALAILLSELSPVISNFFNDVLVMDKDEKIRNNRIALLEKCQLLFAQVGDFSLLK
ncbi:MAG: glycine--tRNA ligase subunit beta [Synergistaceae bacterium]